MGTHEIAYWTAAGYIIHLAPFVLRSPEGATVAKGEQWVTVKPSDPEFATWKARTVMVLPKRFERLVKA